jgi:hypothetical protein
MGAGVEAMFRKQVGRSVDSLDPPSWPPSVSRSSQLEERPGHRPDLRFCALQGPHTTQTEIFVTAVGGGEPTDLTMSRGVSDWGPAWPPGAAKPCIVSRTPSPP